MSPNNAEMANSADPDQTALGAVWSGSALCAQAYIVQKLRIIKVNQSIQILHFFASNTTQLSAHRLFN